MDHTKPTDRRIFYLYIGLLIWLPLPKASVYPWATSLFTATVLALCAYWCFLYFRRLTNLPAAFIKAWPAIVLLLLCQLWVLISTTLLSGESGGSLDPGRSTQQLLQGIGLTALFTLTLLLLQTRKRIIILLYALIISGVGQALYGSLMMLSGTEYNLLFPKEHYLGVATGTFVNRNHLAGYLELCLAIGIGFMIATLKEGNRSWKDLGRGILEALLGSKARVRLGLIIMVSALVMTHSRMGNTAFFASLTATGIIALILSKHASRATIVLLTSLLIIDLAIVGTFFGVDNVIDRIENTSLTTVRRDEVNAHSYTLLNDYFLSGTGAGSFYGVFPEYRAADVGHAFYDYAHNDYLQFAIEFGLIGFIPLLLVVLLSFLIALRAQRVRRDPLMRGLSFTAMMAIIAFAIHSTVDFNLQIPANAATFIVILALGWMSLYFKETKPHRTRKADIAE
ncbi:MAG: O-antigen ligase family protein [Pontibacterium sp.]